MCSCKSCVLSSSSGYKGGPDGFGIKYITVASICTCVWELLYHSNSTDSGARAVLRTGLCICFEYNSPK